MVQIPAICWSRRICIAVSVRFLAAWLFRWSVGVIATSRLAFFPRAQAKLSFANSISVWVFRGFVESIFRFKVRHISCISLSVRLFFVVFLKWVIACALGVVGGSCRSRDQMVRFCWRHCRMAVRCFLEGGAMSVISGEACS